MTHPPAPQPSDPSPSDATPSETTSPETTSPETHAKATPLPPPLPLRHPASDGTSAPNMESQANPNDPQTADFTTEARPGPNRTPTEISASSRNAELTPNAIPASRTNPAVDIDRVSGTNPVPLSDDESDGSGAFGTSPTLPVGNPSPSAVLGPGFTNTANSGPAARQSLGTAASDPARAGGSTTYGPGTPPPGMLPRSQSPSEPRKKRRPWTLRTRLVVAVLLLATVGLAVFGVASVLLIRESLIDRVDQQLEELTHRGPGGLRIVPPPSDGQVRRNNQDLPTDFAIRSYFPDGTVYLSNNVTDTTGPVLPVVNVSTYPQLARQPFTADDLEGKAAWRVRITQRTLSQGTVMYVAVAQSLDTVEETVSRLVWIEALVGVAALATLGAIGFWVVRLGLRPLTKIEHTAGSIAGGHLYLRVPSDSRTEVGRLGAVLNTMVGRLSSALRQREHSEARLRRFVADASHELRTPLTSIRGFAELNRRGGAPERADVDKLMGRIEDEAIRMGLLVEDLLLLARLDQERALDLTELDLRTLVEDAVHDARARDPDRPVQLDTPVRVTADEHRMRQVITNLVNNAVIHTPPGSPVHVTVGKPATPDKRLPVAVAGVMDSRARVVLEVVDQGPGIPLEAAPNIFDRFYRVDSARSRRRGGTGLGLAITAAILEAHGGRVELRTAPAQGARFTVLLPLL
jgi:two-component system OmpR family sensor kinase